MPTNLTPAQLAEGARLLEAVTIEHYGLIICPNEPVSAAVKWLLGNCTELMNAAHRVAEVEGYVREIRKSLLLEATIAERTMHKTGPCDESTLLEGEARGLRNAANILERLAARHNIDLSEPTPAGEAKRGER